jgi:hypothetical protein
MQDENDVTVAMSKMAVLMDHFQRYCASVEQQVDAAMKRLDAIAGKIPQQLQHSADSMLGNVPSQIVDKVGEHLDAPVQAFERQLDTSSHALQRDTHAIAETLQAIRQLHRWLVWKVLGAVAGCLLLLMAGGTWLAAHYAQVVRQNQVSAELMSAYNSADVATCGKRLCARVEAKGERYGEKGQYVQIRLR